MLHVASHDLFLHGRLYLLTYFIHFTQLLTPCPVTATILFSLWALLLFLFCLFIHFAFEISHVSEIMWYLSFSDLFHLIHSRPIHVATNGKISFFICGSVVVHYVCVHLLHPFIHQWTLRLFSYLGYYK